MTIGGGADRCYLRLTKLCYQSHASEIDRDGTSDV